jgi:guanylate kinase
LPSSTTGKGAGTGEAAKPVFVVTGPSGAGKGTLIQLVLPRFPDLAVAVSATTRPQRPGEEDGVHYHFLSREDFQAKVDAGEFLEYVDYVGNRYGTLKSEIDRLRAAGKAPLLELETEGALRVKRRDELAVTIFVTAPVDELEQRLRKRATESSGAIGERIETAKHQLEQQGQFDFVVENEDRDRAADALAAIVTQELDRAATMAAQ